MRWLAFAALLLLTGSAHGQSADPDEQAARRHFERGAQLYEAQAYGQAMREFEVARSLKPTPAFDYNIARCHERLEAWSAAADAYQRYLDARPEAPDAEPIRRRVDELRRRAPVASAPPPTKKEPARPLARLRGPAIAMAAVAGALAVVGAGLTLSIGPAIEARTPECTERRCTPEDVVDLHARLDAGYALLGVAAAALVIDVALFIADARARRTPPLRAVAGGLEVRF